MIYCRGDAGLVLAHLEPKGTGHREDILVAAATHIHADDVVTGQFWRNLHDMGQRVGWLERGNDALHFTAQLERLKGLAVCDRDILRAADIVQPAVLRANTGIIEPG